MEKRFSINARLAIRDLEKTLKNKKNIKEQFIFLSETKKEFIKEIVKIDKEIESIGERIDYLKSKLPENKE